VVLRIPLGQLRLHLRDSHPVSSPFPERSVRRRWRDRGPTTPVAEAAGLGSSAFARHYSQNSCLFLGLLRCFSSPGSLSRRSSAPCGALGFPIRTSLAVCVCTRLTSAFRSVPRPSSALDAQASPVCSYLLCPVIRRIGPSCVVAVCACAHPARRFSFLFA
jgi:hypothetical protein